jgi:hypothetical protein
VKKIVVLSVFLLITVMIIGDCNAKNIQEAITSVRMNLGKTFNETVNLLKDQLRPQDELIKSETIEIKGLYDTAKDINDRVVAGEINPTLLEHGTVIMHKCDPSEELYWNGNKWKCKSVEAEINCSPNSGEVVKDGQCVQEGSYSAGITGWDDCSNNKGERYTVSGCMFTNSKDGSQIQVDDSKCSSVKQYEQACGPYGQHSTCKCPEGYKYSYANGKAFCQLPVSISNKAEDMRDSFDGTTLRWGVRGNNYWFGTCDVERRILEIDLLEPVQMVLTETHFDDYIWILVNGELVYSGPYGQGMYGYRNERFNWFMTSDGKKRACELSTSWAKYPNIDISKYLKVGKNILDMRVLMWCGGEGSATFKVYGANGGKPLPVCEKR